MLASLDAVSFGYDDRYILEDISLTVNEGDRTGLIGPNGEGKTTLINILMGSLTPDRGTVTLKKGIRIGYLEQNGGYDSGRTVYGEMMAAVKEETSAVERLESLTEEISRCNGTDAEYMRLSDRIESLHRFIAARDCYNTEVRMKTVLSGLGFADRYSQVIDTMSGGEKTRLKLARILIEQPDLIILDEPTNHLDMETMYWLEDYLSSFKGAVFTVSHDRYFLDRTVTKICEIENRKLLSFRGNYSAYRTQKAERDLMLRRAYEKQQAENRRLREYIERNGVRTATAASAQSRMKKLEKEEEIEKPYTPPSPPRYRFVCDIKPFEKVLEITHMDLFAGGRLLVRDINITVRRGDRIALIGSNGTGKSTLLKEIMSGGNMGILRGGNVCPAMYDQENANLNGDSTVLREMWDRHVSLSQTEVRSRLASCGLYAEDMDKKVSTLSGGERAKLALCVFESERGNFLLLDEPTNHLDLPAREALEKAIREFDGTVLFVSHDRYFIRALAGRIAEIEDGKFTVYEGGLDFYTEKKKEMRDAEASHVKSAPPPKTGKEGHRSARQRADEIRTRRILEETGDKIETLEKEEAEINASLTDPGVYGDYEKLSALTERLGEIHRELDILYDEYGKLI